MIGRTWRNSVRPFSRCVIRWTRSTRRLRTSGRSRRSTRPISRESRSSRPPPPGPIPARPRPRRSSWLTSQCGATTRRRAKGGAIVVLAYGDISGLGSAATHPAADFQVASLRDQLLPNPYQPAKSYQPAECRRLHSAQFSLVTVGTIEARGVWNATNISRSASLGTGSPGGRDTSGRGGAWTTLPGDAGAAGACAISRDHQGDRHRAILYVGTGGILAQSPAVLNYDPSLNVMNFTGLLRIDGGISCSTTNPPDPTKTGCCGKLTARAN